VGIRFSIYQVDRGPFEVLLDRRIGEVYEELTLRGADPEDLIQIVDHGRVRSCGVSDGCESIKRQVRCAGRRWGGDASA